MHIIEQKQKEKAGVFVVDIANAIESILIAGIGCFIIGGLSGFAIGIGTGGGKK